MTSLSTLAEMESDEPELIPEILTVDARLSIKARVEVLLPLFQRAASVSPRREVIPGTGHALFEVVSGNKNSTAFARITASDGDQTVRAVNDPLEVVVEGAVLVPAQRVLDILKLVPTQTVRIEVIGTLMKIRAGRAQWNVQLPPGEGHSASLDASDIEMHAVPAAALERALSVARAAASTMDARLALTQVLVRNGTITGCDGGRLHRSLCEGLDPTLDFTIRVSSVDELLKALRASEAQFAEIGYDETRVLFSIDRDIVLSQRLLIPFPSVEALLLGPVFSNQDTLAIDRRVLADAIKRVRINADPDSAAITLGLVPKRTVNGESSWQLGLRARDRADNASIEVLDCVWSGASKPKNMTFNHHYLSDLLSSYSADEVFFKVGEDSKSTKTPILIEDQSLGFTGIVQQMHAAW